MLPYVLMDSRRCHSGELYYVFGSLPAGAPYRDEHDLPFMQMTLDTWTAFARTWNPNPDPAFLTSRGFASTAAQFAAQSPWMPVTSKNYRQSPLRELQWGSYMTNFKDASQCNFFDYPLDYYEHDLATA